MVWQCFGSSREKHTKTHMVAEMSFLEAHIFVALEHDVGR